MQLFSDHEIGSYFNLTHEKIFLEVKDLSEEHISSDNLEHLSAQIAKKCAINPLKINFERGDFKILEVFKHGSEFPKDADVARDKVYKCAKVLYQFPVLFGDVDLLRIKFRNEMPSASINAHYDATNLYVEHIIYQNVVEITTKIKQELEGEMLRLRQILSPILQDINDIVVKFNESLESVALELILQRKSMNNEIHN